MRSVFQEEAARVLALSMCLISISVRARMQRNPGRDESKIDLHFLSSSGKAGPVNASSTQFLLEDFAQTSRIGAGANAYKHASPFPHAIFDNLLPAAVIEAVLKEIPEVSDCRTSVLRGHCAESSVDFMKFGVHDTSQFGPHTQALVAMFKSQRWMDVLSKLTGIGPLYAEPLNQGSGVHISGNGGHLSVHVDFNKGGNGELQRRVNTFLYLNPDWCAEYGGHLELWPRNVSACEQRIAPTANRYVVFTCNDFSFHGHPEPMVLPDGRARRSIAIYYYTKGGRPADDCAVHQCHQDEPKCLSCRSHSTLWKKTKADPPNVHQHAATLKSRIGMESCTSTI